VCHDATAEEFMDFFLDDPARMKWVSFLNCSVGWMGMGYLLAGTIRTGLHDMKTGHDMT
jgi:hypothetical protein